MPFSLYALILFYICNRNYLTKWSFPKSLGLKSLFGVRLCVGPYVFLNAYFLLLPFLPPLKKLGEKQQHVSDCNLHSMWSPEITAEKYSHSKRHRKLIFGLVTSFSVILALSKFLCIIIWYDFHRTRVVVLP